MEIERIIQDTLTRFIQSHIPAADLSGMDDVFFSYITGVLEELGSPESSEETFDMDTFVEMMEAYIPGFAEIHSGDVCEMMFSLSERLGEARNREKLGQKAVESRSEAPPEDLTKGQEAGAGACNGERLCTLTDGAGAQEGADLKDGVELLLEMFPACTVSQAEKALAMALGNLEEAVQLIVEEKVEIGPAGASVKVLYSDRGGSGPRSRAELSATTICSSRNFHCRNFMHDKPGRSCRVTAPLPSPGSLSIGCTHNQARTPVELWLAPLSPWSAPPAAGFTELAGKLYVCPVVLFTHQLVSSQELARPRRAPNHEELKQVILQKYMMVDSADDQKTHRPAPPKEAPKKLIRYIDNQVVSTKGERYKDIKKPESEEMKRTYISLKPARKYKFH
ncbi:CUE domain-containing protein 2 isoform X1 [Vidua chalybeata]|uniref:CUE domain-containing protein 2 isoform X1 n=1 Tax=Vidua chalybeata TaxID=81927 RepID=UPI0023A8A6FE|nr:CUE domain-containing protein 2 isoform X1 [Vidua chalybeata]XP_053805438.1 CUE domain-containing protein 2 isoform X1 [Vidua chalybeata]XP_053805439.1 CUE domain-containing protein 2 isoform X1 [Vidua chalybeata]